MKDLKDIENWEILKREHVENRARIIDRIRKKCECALPEEYALPEEAE